MTTIEPAVSGFFSPFEVPVPEGCDGWESMYPYYALFSEERRDSEEARGWFRDGMHFPEPMFPFDFVTADSPYMCLGQANSRIFCVPPALGIDHRVLYGWVYMSANPVTDPAEIGRRAELFGQRAGYYFQNWDELFGRWRTKVEATIHEIESLEVPDLPEIEDEAVVTEGRGIGSAHTLLVAYNRLLESVDRIWQYHFEFLNLGYAAYLVFSELCKQNFPDIPDQSIAKMVSGIDVVLFRPDDELKRLAQRALDAGVADAVIAAGSEEALRDTLSASSEGVDWLSDWEAVKTPWFYFSNGNGFYHHHRSWIDDPTVPLGHLRGYVQRLQAGEDVTRPLAEVSAERDRIADEYRSLLGDSEVVAAFDQNLGLARMVFPYVESHNFYVEHWYHTIFWNKVREFGALLARNQFLHVAEDIFYLQRHEISDALVDLRLAWAAGSVGRGPRYWPPIVERRKRTMEAMRKFTPPPALGVIPEAITEPMTIMLWGITTERVKEWAAGDRERGGTLTGFAGSPGVAEGPARVILDVERLGDLQSGEILVAPVTSPSWTPVFGKIAAAVSDMSGSCRMPRSSPVSTGCRPSWAPVMPPAGSRPATACGWTATPAWSRSWPEAMADARYDAVVIGGGHHATIIAPYLARAGLSVLVLERTAHLGGGACGSEGPAPGFVMNHCSHWTRFYAHPAYREFALYDEGLRYVFPEENEGMIFDDGSSFVGFSASHVVDAKTGRQDRSEENVGRTYEQIGRFSARDAETYLELLAAYEQHWKQAFRRHRFSTPPPWGTPDPLEELLALPESRIEPVHQFMTLRQLAQDFFESPELQILFVRAATTSTGCYPDDVPGLQGLIHCLPLTLSFEPAAIAQGGSQAITDALVAAGRKLGVAYATTCEVDRIVVSDNRATGVELTDGSRISAQLVVSDLGLSQTVLSLLREAPVDERLRRRIRNIHYDRGQLLWANLAIHEPPRYLAERDNPGVGAQPRLYWGPKDLNYLHLRYQPEILMNGFASRPYVLCSVDSLWDETRAPAGSHIVGVEEFSAPRRRFSPQQWRAIKERFTENLLREWGRYAPNMTAENVIATRVYSPEDIQRERANMIEGGYSTGSTIASQLGRFRPIPDLTGHRVLLENLYDCSANLHSGSGIGRGSSYNCYQEIAQALHLEQPAVAA